MPKKTPVLEVEIVPGAKYPDLESAQRAALPLMVDSMLAVIQGLLNSGDLIVIDNELKPNTKKENDEI